MSTENTNLKVIHIGEKSNDNRNYSVKQVVEELLKDLNKEDVENKWSGCFIALVDNDRNSYMTGFRIANLSASESIALLEVMKIRMLGSMNFVKSSDNT